MQELGKVEDTIFRDRQRNELNFRSRNKAKRRRERLESDQAPAWVPQGQFAPQVRNLLLFEIIFMSYIFYFQYRHLAVDVGL